MKRDLFSALIKAKINTFLFFRMKKSFSFVFIVVIMGASGLGYYFYKQIQYNKENVPAAVSIAQLEQSQKAFQALAQGSSQVQTQQNIQVPPELNIKMTFYPQAPSGDWSEPWQEACEEASILLVANTYYNHNWTRQQFGDEILKLVDWENNTFGDYKNTNAKQIVQMLQDYLGRKPSSTIIRPTAMSSRP